MKQHIVLVMELCEYDLDYLVKMSPFREDDITLFLFQLGEQTRPPRPLATPPPFPSLSLSLPPPPSLPPRSIERAYSIYSQCIVGLYMKH